MITLSSTLFMETNILNFQCVILEGRDCVEGTGLVGAWDWGYSIVEGVTFRRVR